MIGLPGKAVIAFLARAATVCCCCCCHFCCWSNWAAAVVVIAATASAAAVVVVVIIAIDLPATAQAKARHCLHVDAVFSVATPDRLYSITVVYYFCKERIQKQV